MCDRLQKGSGTVAVRNAYIRVVGIHAEPSSHRRDGRDFTEEEELKYQAMARRGDIYDLLSRSIAPSIFGSDGGI